MPADPAAVDGRRKRIDSPAIEVDDDRPAGATRRIGATQAKGVEFGGSPAAPNSTITAVITDSSIRWW
jgi:hypothetical protein